MLIETNPELRWDYSQYCGKLATMLVDVCATKKSESKADDFHIPAKTVVMIIAMYHQAVPQKLRKNRNHDDFKTRYMSWLTFQATHYFEVLLGEQIYYFKGTKLTLVPKN